MRKKKLFTAAMVILMLLPTGCSKDEIFIAETTTELAETTEAVTEPIDEYGRPLIESAISDDVIFNGEEISILFRVAIPGTTQGATLMYEEFYAPEETGDIINDAVYERNMRVEERLGINLCTTELKIQMISAHMFQKAHSLRMTHMILLPILLTALQRLPYKDIFIIYQSLNILMYQSRGGIMSLSAKLPVTIRYI